MAENDVETGKRVQRLREGKGWSREALAFHAGVSSKTIERIEKGLVEGRRHTIRSIAEALDVDEYAVIGEPTGPLGVPLSTQVDGGFDEFRAHVAALHEHIGRLEEQVNQARRERAQAADEIRGLLHQQSALLELIRAILSVDPEGNVTLQDRLIGMLRDAAGRAGAPSEPSEPS